jgi:hypothetical protein
MIAQCRKACTQSLLNVLETGGLGWSSNTAHSIGPRVVSMICALSQSLASVDAPEPRAMEPPQQGRVVAIPQVGGLHHRSSDAPLSRCLRGQALRPTFRFRARGKCLRCSAIRICASHDPQLLGVVARSPRPINTIATVVVEGNLNAPQRPQRNRSRMDRVFGNDSRDCEVRVARHSPTIGDTLAKRPNFLVEQ